MEKMYVKNLQAGMVTAAEVRTKGGQLIIDKGVALNLQLIMRLTFYNIDAVMIEDWHKPDERNESAGSLPVRPQNTQSYSQKFKTSKEFHSFQMDHTLVLTLIRTNLESYINSGTPLQTDELLRQTAELFDSCKTSLEMFDMLHNMRSLDDSIYAHSLNVALICRQLGKWLKWDDEALDTLTLGGLLHDIGKLKVPDEILNKPGKYTDQEFTLVKMHPKYGYDLLKNQPVDTHIKKMALSHHERCDGTGYPMGLTQDDTDEFAMIAAIADVYDAMTAARSYRAPLCPFQVIDKFEKEGLQMYNPKFILTFLERIAGTYQNNRILLSDGRSAKIVMLNQNHLSKPIVQLDDGFCIDLSTQSELHIQAIM